MFTTIRVGTLNSKVIKNRDFMPSEYLPNA